MRKPSILFSAILVVLLALALAGGCQGEPPEVTYTLDVTVNPSGAGIVSLSPSGGTYDAGTEVTLTANPTSGYIFDHWSGDATGTRNPVVITVDSDKEVTAYFSEVVAKSGIIFEDDFVDNRNNWGVSPSVGDPVGLTTYIEHGAYHVVIEPSGRATGLSQTKNLQAAGLTSFACELEMIKVGGAEDKASGLIFLVGSDKGQYLFLITGGGYYTLYQEKDKEVVDVVPLTESGYIRQGNTSNKLMVICSGSIIELYINDQLVNSISGQFPSDTGGNGIGLRVGGPNIHIAFESIKMWVVTP